MYGNFIYLMISSVIIHLLLSHVVFCDYEMIWNVYYEKKCCAKDILKYHSGKNDELEMNSK
jgi:hypothetical protein